MTARDNAGDGGDSMRTLRRLAASAPPGSPEIIVMAGEQRTTCVDRALDLLTPKPHYFKQDRRLVRTFRHRMRDAARREILVTGIIEVTKTTLLHELALAAHWCKFNAKKQKVRIDPPGEAADTILDKPDLWPFPTLTGLHSTPTRAPTDRCSISRVTIPPPGYTCMSYRRCRRSPISRQSLRHWRRCKCGSTPSMNFLSSPTPIAAWPCRACSP
jgi:hypothetical protein